MRHETVTYQCDDKQFKGYLALPATAGERLPTVIVAHAWRGQDAFARRKADQLAAIGYVAFAADLYGDGVEVDNDQAPGMMMPLFLDRATLRKRIVAAYEAVRTLPQVDRERIGAMGFCFGGLTAIELMRSGVLLRGVVSFHGLLGYNLGDQHATPAPAAQRMQGSLLILHGHDDPMVSLEDITSIENEMTKADVDWQIHIFGHTSHAFTNPDAHSPQAGTVYNPIADKRAWQSMLNFFQERFAP